MQTEIILIDFKNLLVFFFPWACIRSVWPYQTSWIDERLMEESRILYKVCLRNTCDLITNLRIE